MVRSNKVELVEGHVNSMDLFLLNLIIQDKTDRYATVDCSAFCVLVYYVLTSVDITYASLCDVKVCTQMKVLLS